LLNQAWEQESLKNSRQDRKCRSPTQTGQICPTGVHFARRISKQAAEDFERDQSADLQKRTRCESESLKDEVRDVKVRSQRQVLRQSDRKRSWILDDLRNSRGSSRSHRRDQENLYDLEPEE